MSEMRHCDGCGEDYDVFEESHVGHEVEVSPAPLLATRDALAIGLHAVTCEYGRMAYTAVCEAEHRAQADALLASGVVRDPATLADDEALVGRVATEEGLTPTDGPVWEDRAHEIAFHLRALAAALTAHWTCEYGYEHRGDHQPELCARMAVFG